MLHETIASIAAQDYDLDLVEVIVMTQNPEHSLDNLNAETNVNLKVCYQPADVTISALRNLGVEQSSGEYLAFLDADIALSSNWVNVMLLLLNDPEHTRAIVSAVQTQSDNAPALEVIRTEISNAKTDCNVDFLPGRNLFMSKDVFQQIGGFPEHLVTCEDYYFTDKANAFGKLFYSSKATYIHLGEDKEFLQMYKKEIWRGQSNLLSIKGRKVPIAEIPSFFAPVWVCLFYLLACIAVLMMSWAWALGFIILGTIPLIVYSARLYVIAQGSVKWWDALRFYGLYFPARTIGTVVGLFKSINFQNS